MKTMTVESLIEELKTKRGDEKIIVKIIEEDGFLEEVEYYMTGKRYVESIRKAIKKLEKEDRFKRTLFDMFESIYDDEINNVVNDALFRLTSYIERKMEE